MGKMVTRTTRSQPRSHQTVLALVTNVSHNNPEFSRICQNWNCCKLSCNIWYSAAALLSDSAAKALDLSSSASIDLPGGQGNILQSTAWSAPICKKTLKMSELQYFEPLQEGRATCAWKTSTFKSCLKLGRGKQRQFWRGPNYVGPD